MPRLAFDHLTDTDFEDFVFDLLGALKFTNVDWRKGTPKKTSPADRVRDIVAQQLLEDVDGSKHLETWFVDCKHFKRAVPPAELHNLLTWAEAERPDIALFAVSGFLSNPAKDHVEAYKRNNRPAFKIKYWVKRGALHRLTRFPPPDIDQGSEGRGGNGSSFARNGLGEQAEDADTLGNLAVAVGDRHRPRPPPSAPFRRSGRRVDGWRSERSGSFQNRLTG